MFLLCIKNISLMFIIILNIIAQMIRRDYFRAKQHINLSSQPQESCQAVRGLQGKGLTGIILELHKGKRLASYQRSY